MSSNSEVKWVQNECWYFHSFSPKKWVFSPQFSLLKKWVNSPQNSPKKWVLRWGECTQLNSVTGLDLKTGHYSIVIVFWNFDGIDKHTNKSLVSFGISFDSKTKIFVKMISRKKTIYFWRDFKVNNNWHLLTYIFNAVHSW